MTHLSSFTVGVLETSTKLASKVQQASLQKAQNHRSNYVTSIAKFAVYADKALSSVDIKDSSTSHLHMYIFGTVTFIVSTIFSGDIDQFLYIVY